MKKPIGVFLFWAVLRVVLFTLLLNRFKKVSDQAITENFESYLFRGIKSD